MQRDYVSGVLGKLMPVSASDAKCQQTITWHNVDLWYRKSRKYIPKHYM